MFQKRLYEQLPAIFGFRDFPFRYAQRDDVLDKEENVLENVYIRYYWYVESWHYGFMTPIILIAVYTDKWTRGTLLIAEDQPVKGLPYITTLGPKPLYPLDLEEGDDEVFPALAKLQNIAPTTTKMPHPDTVIGINTNKRFDITFRTTTASGNIICSHPDNNDSYRRLSLAVVNTIHNFAKRYDHEDFYKWFDLTDKLSHEDALVLIGELQAKNVHSQTIRHQLLDKGFSITEIYELMGEG